MLLINGNRIGYFTFPGGELQVQIPTFSAQEWLQPINIIWKPWSAHDIMKLLLAVNALNEHGCTDIHLEILYLPYARQDRQCAPGEAFSLKVMMELLNNLNIRQIKLYDCHSDCEYLMQADKINWQEIHVATIFGYYNVLDDFNLESLVLCAPDKGARSKVNEIALMTNNLPVIVCSKNRNPKTGKIESLHVPSKTDKQEFYGSQPVLVIDDICDGGATFIEVAKQLKANGAGKLYLYVTHGIFSKGLTDLLAYYEHIYCHIVLDNQEFQSSERLTILREFPNEP